MKIIRISLVLAIIAIPFIAFAQQQPQAEYNLKITQQDAQLIGEGLGSLPYNKVALLIQRLQAQITEQTTNQSVPVRPPAHPEHK